MGINPVGKNNNWKCYDAQEETVEETCTCPWRILAGSEYVVSLKPETKDWKLDPQPVLPGWTLSATATLIIDMKNDVVRNTNVAHGGSKFNSPFHNTVSVLPWRIFSLFILYFF